MTNIDDLSIGIKSNVKSATNSIDKLISRLGVLSGSLGQVNTSGFQQMARGISQIEKATRDINADSANKLATLSLAIRKFGSSTANAATSNIPQLSNSIKDLANTINGVGNVNFNVDGLTNFASAINKLGGTKVSDAIINIPILSAALKRMASSIADLGAVDNVASVENLSALSNSLSKMGGKGVTNSVNNLPKLTIALTQMMNTLSRAPHVSQNVIDLTNALANLASQGSRTGSASRSLQNSLNGYSSSAKRAASSSKGLASAIGKLYAKYWMLFRFINKFGEGITLASDLTEVQNVIDVSFGKYKDTIEEFSKTSIQDYGMSELTAKQMAGRFQAMGTAVGFSQEKMSDMSVTLTALAADMASFYNVEQADVAESLQSVFTGTTKPLRAYGIDLTEATLNEWLMSQGIDANIKSMTQAEKVLLRYNYVLAHTTNAQGDFSRTQGTFANQTRILKQQFEQLSAVIGQNFVYALKPVIKGLNAVMAKTIQFANVVSESLGTIFGWKYEDTTGGIVNDLEDGSDFADDLSDGLGSAADNAKKLKQQLQGFDELNVLSTKDNNSNAGNGGANTGYDIPAFSSGQWVKLDDEEKFFSSDIDTLYKLGDYIGDTLTNQLQGINWNNVYQGAKDFGSGLASFLNGLISPELFNETGSTVAGSLNTAIYTALSYGETFDFENFGDSIAESVNGFFEDFDFVALGKTLNTWTKGIGKAMLKAIKGVKWEDILEGGIDLLTELDLETVTVMISAFAWMHGGKEIVANGLANILSTKVKTGIGTSSISASKIIALSLTTAIIGYKIGNTLYDHVPKIQEWSESLVEWLFDGKDSIDISKTITFALSSIALSVGVAKTASKLFNLGGKLFTAEKMVETQVAKASGASLAGGVLSTAFNIVLGVMITYEVLKTTWSMSSTNDTTGIKDEYSTIGGLVKGMEEYYGVDEDTPWIIRKPAEMIFTVSALGFKTADKIQDKTGIGVKDLRKADNGTQLEADLQGIQMKIGLATLGIGQFEFYGGVSEFKKKLANAIPNLTEKIKEITINLGMKFGPKGLEELKTDFTSKWTNFVNKLSEITGSKENKAKYSNAGKEISKGVAEGISDKWNAKDGVNATVNSELSNTTKNNLGSTTYWKSKGIDLSQGLIYGIYGKWHDGDKSVNAYVKALLNQTTKNELGSNATWKTPGSNLVSGLLTGVSDKWSNGDSSLLKTVQKKLSATTKALGGTGTWKDPGINLVSGLMNGISDKWGTSTSDKQSLIGSVANLATNLTSALKKAFGIHSPSKIWADDVGYYLTKGLEVGILDEEGHLDNAIINMGARLTDTMSGALTLATPKSMDSMFNFGVTSTMAHTYSADTSMSTSISEGISRGMYSAQSEQNALLREQNELLYQILQKETISSDEVYNVVVNKNRDTFNRSGYNPLMV